MKKLLLFLFLAAILFSCKSDDYTCPEITYGFYKGTLYLYATRQIATCQFRLNENGEASLSYWVDDYYKRTSMSTTYSCKNSFIILSAEGSVDYVSKDLTGLIPLKYTYDSKRKILASVDDDSNTFGDIVVAFVNP